MEHLVQKIYEFFYDNPSLEKHKTLSDFLDTLPGFRIEEDNGISRIDMNLANYVSSICKQMANDMLLIPVKTNPTFCLPQIQHRQDYRLIIARHSERSRAIHLMLLFRSGSPFIVSIRTTGIRSRPCL